MVKVPNILQGKDRTAQTQKKPKLYAQYMQFILTCNHKRFKKVSIFLIILK